MSDLFGNEEESPTGPNGHELIDQMMDQYKPSHVFACFSGGHDSLTSTHIAAGHPEFRGVLHINTGIGIEETRQFVRDTCWEHGWPLLEYKAEDEGQIYEDLVLEAGFPGSNEFGHRKMYNRLKERAIRHFMRDHKISARDHIALITGCRSQESTRRMGNVNPIEKEGSKIWTAVIHDWDKSQCDDRRKVYSLPENPVVNNLCMSGECLCGAFAHPGELVEIGHHYPETAQKIIDLQVKVFERGFTWGWEGTPPDDWKHGDQDAPSLFEGSPGMCYSCDAAKEKMKENQDGGQ